MCEFSGKLMAWMDGELPDDQMLATERHLAGCQDCRRQLDTFREVSSAFRAVVRDVPRLGAGRSLRRSLAGTGAIAAALMIVLMLHSERPSDVKPSQQPSLQAHRMSSTLSPLRSMPTVAASVSRHRIPKRSPKLPVWMPADPTIEIVIPADALFPPGTLPEGAGFVADLRLAADGSPASVALRP